ncbi:hypothetical protein SUGI_0217350 [Cryptomeria japonica]|nr:hypothetical protein SUGI_0217350 [Cryptomeria japonica]
MSSWVYTYWWKPYSITKIMAEQGIRGPTPRFFTGNLGDMTKLREHKAAQDMNAITHDIVDRLMPHYVQWSTVYGKRFIFWWGTEPRLTISEPELIKELLSAKHGLSYGKSELQQKGVKNFIGKGLLMANGQDWVNQRHIIAPAFHHENLKGHVVHMVESTACLINKWKKSVEETSGEVEIEVMEHFMRLAADIIAKTEFGSSYEEGKRVFEKLGLLQKLSSRGGRYSWFPSNGLRKKRQVVKLKEEVEESLQRVVESRRESVSMGRSTSYGHDLLGLMLAECDKGSTNFTTQELMDECKTFFFAGQDTTSTLLTWTTMLLALHPQWQQRARQEVLSLCNNRPPNFNTLPHMKIMGMILNESLRLYTPASLFAKEAFADMKLGDLFIPKGLSVWIPVLAIHHDKDIWGEDANEFNPKRFANGTARACNNNPMGFIPFSYGPRKCVGQSFAIMEAKIVLAMIIANFKFHLSPSYRHAPISVLTLKPRHGVPIILQPL